MRLDLCIPAYNEERIIVDSLNVISQTLGQAGVDHAITVVDNGSTDATSEKALSVPRVSLRTLSERGKGLAVVVAARESDADVFGFIDADLSADPADVPKLYAHLQSGKYDIVIGSRLMNTAIVERAFLRTLSSRLFNKIRSALLGIHAHDTQCGLKLMTARGRAVLAACEETGWFFDLEFLARAEKEGLRILEVPVHWNEYRYPDRTSKLRMIRDGFGAVRAMLRIRKRLRKNV
jgi:dolichyl-phosphate beta-glucosyltransferase